MIPVPPQMYLLAMLSALVRCTSECDGGDEFQILSPQGGSSHNASIELHLQVRSSLGLCTYDGRALHRVVGRSPPAFSQVPCCWAELQPPLQLVIRLAGDSGAHAKMLTSNDWRRSISDSCYVTQMSTPITPPRTGVPCVQTCV